MNTNKTQRPTFLLISVDQRFISGCEFYLPELWTAIISCWTCSNGCSIVMGMEAFSSDPPDKPLPRARQMPRLSILHLMLWTLCSACYMAIMRAILELQETPDAFDVMQRTTGVMHGVIAGAVMTGAIVLVVTRIRSGPPLVTHPGHWLLLVSASLTAIAMPLFLLFAVAEYLSSYSAQWYAVFGVLYLGQTAACIVAMWHTEEISWKILFGAEILNGALQALNLLNIYSLSAWAVDGIVMAAVIGVIGTLVGMAEYVLGLLVLLLAIVDLYTARQRDWLHWTGVWTYLALVAAELVWAVWYSYAAQPP